MAVASAGTYACLHLTPDRYHASTPPLSFFTGRMPFLSGVLLKMEVGICKRGVTKGLKVPCLFMIAEVSIRCQKNPEVGIRRIPAYTPPIHHCTSCRPTNSIKELKALVSKMYNHLKFNKLHRLCIETSGEWLSSYIFVLVQISLSLGQT